jgi:hypothetical protein
MHLAGDANHAHPIVRHHVFQSFLTLSLLCQLYSAAQTAARDRSGMRSCVQVGLEKLEFTEQQVGVMQKELEALRPSLVRTVAETEQLMAQVRCREGA